MTYYIVCEGIATEGIAGAFGNDWDGTDSVAVIAENPREALDLARKYDAGMIGYDNHVFDGEVVVAVKEV